MTARTLSGLDTELSSAARRALAESQQPASVELIAEALQAPMSDADREMLVSALARLGGTSALARWLAGVHQGLSASSALVDVEGWAEQGVGAAYGAVRPELAEQGLVHAVEEHSRRLETTPGDPGLRLELAEATLALALEAPEHHPTNARRARMMAEHLYAEARRQAEQAQAAGAEGWRLEAVKALAAYYAGDLESAYVQAERAMKDLPPGESGWSSMAVVTVFAESRWKALKAAVKAQQRWPGEWLADLDAAYSVLLKHPLGTDAQVLWHFDLLDWLGARWRADGVLSRGLERFVDSLSLHARLRERVLKRGGPAALLATYDKFVKDAADDARAAPFAGLAAIEAAEQFRRNGERDAALTAYDRAVAWYETAIGADERHAPAASHAIALALAGRSRVAYELGRDQESLANVVASFARSPDSAGTRDGMGITPGETAQMLRARLEEAGRTAELAQLDAAMSSLDPDLLRFDRE